MSTTIGEVNINLRMSLAQFKQDTKSGTEAAGAAGRQIASDMGNSMGEARGAVMLLNEELGVKMPRHLVSLIAKIPGLSAAFAAMLPLVGVIAATKVIYELVEAHKKAQEAMEMAMSEMGAQGATVLGGLNEKLDASKLKFMELADDGAGVVALKLDMLSHTTLTNLVSAFDSLGNSINKVLKDMGADGAFARVMGLANASDSVKNLQKDVLGIRASDASDSAKAEQIGQKIEWYKNKAKADLDAMKADQALLNSSTNGALVAGGGHTNEKQLTEQKATYAALDDMSKAYSLTQQTEAVDTSNIQIEAANHAASEADKIWMAQNTEYQRGLKADEAAEAERYKLAVEGIVESEKLKIDATHQGTQARLDSVIAAIQDEEAHGLQDTAFYRSLQEQKVTIQVDMDNKRIQLAHKLAIEMGKAEQGMISLSMAQMTEQANWESAMHLTTQAQRLQVLRVSAAQELALERQKNADVLAEMSESDPLYPVAVQKRLDADLQAQQKYNDEILKLDHESITQRKAAWDAGFNAMNSGMTTLVGGLVKGNATILTDLKTMLQNMIAQWIDYFLQIQMKALETALFMKVLGLAGGGGIGGSLFGQAGGGAGFGGGGAPVTSSPTANSIPFMADGGDVSAGKPYFTGDAGIELFVPGQDGSIISNALLKSAKDGGKAPVQNFTMNVHGVTDADSFKKSQGQIAADAMAMMAAAHRRNR
jgi:hypothetical protein